MPQDRAISKLQLRLLWVSAGQLILALRFCSPLELDTQCNPIWGDEKSRLHPVASVDWLNEVFVMGFRLRLAPWRILRYFSICRQSLDCVSVYVRKKGTRISEHKCLRYCAKSSTQCAMISALFGGDTRIHALSYVLTQCLGFP